MLINMDDKDIYIKQLEEQNEQLKQLLAEKEVENDELYRRLEDAEDKIRWLRDKRDREEEDFYIEGESK